MATGDLKNNLKKLQAALKSIKYEKDVDIDSLSRGVPGSFLPIYHFAFIEYSRFVAEKINELNIELYGKADLRFIEGMYKVLRELFSYKPALTKDQFFSNGFAEKKVIMCTAILNQVRSMHYKLAPKPRPKTAPTNMTSTLGSNLTAAAVNHKVQPAQNSSSKTLKPSRPQVVKDSISPAAVRNAAFSNISQSKQAPVPVVQVQNELTAHNIVSVNKIGEMPGETVVVKPKNVSIMSAEAQIYPDLSLPQVSPLPQSYNPSAYAADDEVHMSTVPYVEVEQQNVEVVSLNSDTSEDNYNMNLRPIDMVARTPGKPLVQSHVQRKFDASGSTDLLSVVEEKLRTVSENVSRLTLRLTAVEEKLALLEEKPPIDRPHEQTIENILARLTLLENNLKLVKAEAKPPVHNEEQSFADSLEKPFRVNPMPESKTRCLVQSFSEEQNTLYSPAMTSTPVDAVQTLRDSSNKENALPQAERIKAMLKETQTMLNMQVESPVRTQDKTDDAS